MQKYVSENIRKCIAPGGAGQESDSEQHKEKQRKLMGNTRKYIASGRGGTGE